MKTLADIPLSRVWHAQQRAELRIQLYTMGAVHRRLREFAAQARTQLTDAATAEGTLTAVGMAQVRAALDRAWGETAGDVETVADPAAPVEEARVSGKTQGAEIAQSLADWLWADAETLKKRIEKNDDAQG